LPSWKSLAWTCISLKFINAKQSGEKLGSLAQLFSFHLNFLWFYIWKLCATMLTFWLCVVWIFSPVVKLHQKQCSSFFVYLLYMCTLLMGWISIFLWCHIHLSLLELFSCHVEKNCLYFLFSSIMPHTLKKWNYTSNNKGQEGLMHGVKLLSKNMLHVCYCFWQWNYAIVPICNHAKSTKHTYSFIFITAHRWCITTPLSTVLSGMGR